MIRISARTSWEIDLSLEVTLLFQAAEPVVCGEEPTFPEFNGLRA
jgi:hypothetical protein